MIAEPALLSEYTIFALDHTKWSKPQSDSVVSPAFPFSSAWSVITLELLLDPSSSNSVPPVLVTSTNRIVTVCFLCGVSLIFFL